MSFQALNDFENEVAEFFRAPYAVATDCCTHAIEMCLQLKFYVHLDIPAKTYVSLPFMLEKIRMPYRLVDKNWRDTMKFVTNDPKVCVVQFSYTFTT